MGDALNGRKLVRQSAARWGREPDQIEQLLGDAPLDFPIVITDRLPFGVERRGMSGITLRGRVYIHQSMLSRHPREVILLIRHEAEHVRQQRRAPIWFYIRYGCEWAAALVRRLPFSGQNREPRWRRAYRMIAAERQAYRAEARARERLEASTPIEVE